MLFHNDDTEMTRCPGTPKSILARALITDLHCITPPPSHNGFLFPRLRTIEWMANGFLAANYMLRFCSSSISDIDLSVNDTETTGDTPSRLRILEALAAMPGLRLKDFRLGISLRRQVDQKPVQDAVMNLVKRQSAPTRLSLIGPIPIEPRSLLNHLPALKQLTICVSDLDPDIKNISEGIADHLPFLERIFISIQAHNNANLTFPFPLPLPTTPGHTFQTIRPLLRLSHLNALTLKGMNPLILSSDDIRDMGAAWPKMAHLSLIPWPMFKPKRRNAAVKPRDVRFQLWYHTRNARASFHPRRKPSATRRGC